MIKRYCEDLLQFVRCKRFVVCIVALLVIAYGFAAANPTVGVDDLEIDRYVGSGNEMLAAGRFGIWFWSNLFVFNGPYFSDLIAMFLLSFASINFCILFQRASYKKLPMSSYLVFCCVFLTYPIWSEIWEFTGANAVIGGGMLFASFALLLIFEFIHNKEQRSVWQIAAAILMLMIVCAGYESVVCVYIFLVFAVLFLQAVWGTNKENTGKEMIRQGLIYALVLTAGLVLRVVVHEVLLAVLELEKQTNGSTKILWGSLSAANVIGILVLLGTFQFGLKALINISIAELHIAGILLFAFGFGFARKRGKAIWLTIFGMQFSLVALSFLQGFITQYRSCQVFAVFVAFVVMLGYALIVNCKGRYSHFVRVAVSVLCCCLCVYQAGSISNVLYWNHVRSEEEAYVVREIGTDLQRSFAPEKPVIFVGNYALSSYIREGVSVKKDSFGWKIYNSIMTDIFNWIGSEPLYNVSSRQYTQSTVTSMLTWGTSAFEQEAMWKFFKYYGFEYTCLEDPNLIEDAKEYIKQEDIPVYPKDGYIVDRGSYLIVRIGKNF